MRYLVANVYTDDPAVDEPSHYILPIDEARINQLVDHQTVVHEFRLFQGEFLFFAGHYIDWFEDELDEEIDNLLDYTMCEGGWIVTDLDLSSLIETGSKWIVGVSVPVARFSGERPSSVIFSSLDRRSEAAFWTDSIPLDELASSLVGPLPKPQIPQVELVYDRMRLNPVSLFYDVPDSNQFVI